MSKSNRHSINYITKAAAIAALYVVLTELSAQFGLAGTNLIQFRISEALTILPFFTSAAIPGLAIGCLLSNLLTGAVFWDVVFGTVAMLIGAILTYALRRYGKWLAPIPPILANTVIVPFVLRYAYGMTQTWWLLALFVFIGEFVCCGVLGMPLLLAVNRHPAFILDQNAPAKAKPRSLRERFPLYIWITLGFLLTIDLLTFYATRPLLPYLPAHSLSTPLDELIPLRPAWVTIYFLSFLSWILTIVWILAESKRHAYRLCGVYSIIMLVSLICFLAYPVTIQRPEITDGGFFNGWMRFLYAVDSPTNLCPSLHVVISYICWRCTMDCRKIPKWYQWFNLFFLILVCFSILLVKQHFVLDIVVAVIVTEGAIRIGRLTRIERIGFAIENKLTRRKAA